MEKKEEEKTKVFLGCLPQNTNKEELLVYFTKICKISNFKIKNRSNNQCAGYGTFICLEPSKSEILFNQPHFHQGRSLECRPYLSGDDLKKYHLEFNKKRLYIGNLPYDITDLELFNFFNNISPVLRAYSLKKENKGEKDCFGFVIFKEKEALEFVRMKKRYIRGYLLEVKYVNREKNTKNSNKMSSTVSKKPNKEERSKKRNRKIKVENLVQKKNSDKGENECYIDNVPIGFSYLFLQDNTKKMIKKTIEMIKKRHTDHSNMVFKKVTNSFFDLLNYQIQ